MKMIIASVLALASATNVVDGFTLSGELQAQSRIGGPVTGGDVVAATVSRGSLTVQDGAGKATVFAVNCASWSAQPESSFESLGVCNAQSSAGEFVLSFSCAAAGTSPLLMDCWGRLSGISGGLQTRTGIASWHHASSRDGKVTVMSGTGSWTNSNRRKS